MLRARIIAMALGLVAAVLAIALMARVLPEGAAVIALDIKRATWPVTVQNVLWLVFFLGLAELVIRWYQAWLEASQVHRGYLPEDDETVLRPGDDMTPIYQKVRASRYRERLWCSAGFRGSGET